MDERASEISVGSLQLCAAEILIRATNSPLSKMEETKSRVCSVTHNNQFVIHRKDVKDFLIVRYDPGTNLLIPLTSYPRKHQARAALLEVV
jgi:hypothetical protein